MSTTKRILAAVLVWSFLSPAAQASSASDAITYMSYVSKAALAADELEPALTAWFAIFYGSMGQYETAQMWCWVVYYSVADVEWRYAAAVAYWLFDKAKSDPQTNTLPPLPNLGFTQ